MTHTRIAIASPIPAEPTPRFLAALPKNCDVLISDDSNGNLLFPKERPRTISLDYDAQRHLLGDAMYRKFEPYHKSAACRNIVHYLAYKEGYEYVVSLDYDCVVPRGFLDKHQVALETEKLPSRKSASGWVNPLESDKWYSRGYPYSRRITGQKVSESISRKRVVLNMGLWKNVVDINGIDKVLKQPPKAFVPAHAYTAVDGFIPLCGMNNMFLREVIPAYFFIPNVRVGDGELSRHDDIWGGYIFQLLVRKKGDRITYGEPTVLHERESNQARVLHHEHFMHALEPYFYSLTDAAAENVSKGSYRDMFAQFSEEFASELSKRRKNLPPHYFAAFKDIAESLELWRTLFTKLS